MKTFNDKVCIKLLLAKGIKDCEGLRKCFHLIIQHQQDVENFEDFQFIMLLKNIFLLRLLL